MSEVQQVQELLAAEEEAQRRKAIAEQEEKLAQELQRCECERARDTRCQGLSSVSNCAFCVAQELHLRAFLSYLSKCTHTASLECRGKVSFHTLLLLLMCCS